MMLFEDRRDAGRRLAVRLSDWRSQPNVVVLGIPRGGVIVAAEVARGIGAPLDVFITHKLGAPDNSELAIGAVASDGSVFLNESILADYGYEIPQRFIAQERDHQLREIRRREALYRQGRPPLALGDQTVILVDDGIATGATTVAALRALRNTATAPARLILAVPVAPGDTAHAFARECDEAVFLATPDWFQSVGRFYARFEQTTDAQVIEALASV